MTPGVNDTSADDARLDADVRGFVARSRAALRDGGPAVDHAAVADLIWCELPAGEDEKVRGLVTTYRAWHDAFWLHYGPLAADLANQGEDAENSPGLASEETTTDRAAPAALPARPSRTWLLGLVRGLVESECPDESVRRTLAESLDGYAEHGRPADDSTDLWDVLIGLARTHAGGDDTHTDRAAGGDRPGLTEEVPTTVAFARHLLRVACERLARTSEFAEESLRVTAARRLAGWSVEAIARDLRDDPEIVRVGLRLISKRWTLAGGPVVGSSGGGHADGR